LNSSARDALRASLRRDIKPWDEDARSASLRKDDQSLRQSGWIAKTPIMPANLSSPLQRTHPVLNQNLIQAKTTSLFLKSILPGLAIKHRKRLPEIFSHNRLPKFQRS
jgi:hypothetical protein